MAVFEGLKYALVWWLARLLTNCKYEANLLALNRNLGFVLS